MSEIRIARRYAKSILELAAEQNSMQQVSEDIAYLKEAFQNRDLVNLIKSPIINKGKKLEIFSKLFAGKLSNLTNLFLTRVIKKGRESIIPEMVGSFNQQYNDQKGIVAATLTTTSTMDAASLESVKSKINELVGAGKEVQLQIQHDDNLIGGFLLEFEDKRFDASVKHQLENIKKSFSS